MWQFNHPMNSVFHTSFASFTMILQLNANKDNNDLPQTRQKVSTHMKIDWTRKLTSRKFWMALAAFIVGVLALFGTDTNTTQQISGVIMSLGAVVAYIVGGGLADFAGAGATTINNNFSGDAVVETIESADRSGMSVGTKQAAAVKDGTAL